MSLPSLRFFIMVLRYIRLLRKYRRFLSSHMYYAWTSERSLFFFCQSLGEGSLCFRLQLARPNFLHFHFQRSSEEHRDAFCVAKSSSPRSLTAAGAAIGSTFEGGRE